MTAITGWPVCGRCGKPVAEVRTVMDRVQRALILTALCHGASETIRVPAYLAIAGTDFRIDGVAFAQKADELQGGEDQQAVAPDGADDIGGSVK